MKLSRRTEMKLRRYQRTTVKVTQKHARSGALNQPRQENSLLDYLLNIILKIDKNGSTKCKMRGRDLTTSVKSRNGARLLERMVSQSGATSVINNRAIKTRMISTERRYHDNVVMIF